ncbi:uncharacterized protein [Rutidosis leptorrhynchoides]|uniref:uncharacterized protein n=1 Tax=Rutidosis leptorrhynchoides TaxID=125765 RepID=UPI003A99C661
MWLLVLEKLKTQDKLKPWEVNVSSASNVCVLCKSQQDSHDHLFFECPYSKHVWSKILDIMPLQIVYDKWKDVFQCLYGVANRRVARVVVSKILLSTSVYFIWQERNSRLFNNGGQNPDQLFKAIILTVRLKMRSLKFKESHHVRDLRLKWNI